MYWVDRLKNFLRQPARTLMGELLRRLLGRIICGFLWLTVIVPWAGAAYLIRSHARPSSPTYTYMTGILFGTSLIALLYVYLRIVEPMVRRYPRLIEDRGRCFYYWRRTLPVLAVLTLVTGAKFYLALRR